MLKLCHTVNGSPQSSSAGRELLLLLQTLRGTLLLMVKVMALTLKGLRIAEYICFVVSNQILLVLLVTLT